MRHDGPAPSGAVHASCEHCPLAQLLPTEVPTIEDAPAAATAPQACSQRMVSFAGDVTPKGRQRLR